MVSLIVQSGDQGDIAGARWSREKGAAKEAGTILRLRWLLDAPLPLPQPQLPSSYSAFWQTGAREVAEGQVTPECCCCCSHLHHRLSVIQLRLRDLDNGLIHRTD